jgi:hypothetical protein
MTHKVDLWKVGREFLIFPQRANFGSYGGKVQSLGFPIFPDKEQASMHFPATVLRQKRAGRNRLKA